MALALGETVPDFALRVATRDSIADFRLKDHLGGKTLVFGFFPVAFTRTCTRELCEFRDHLTSLADLDAVPFGFSTDTPHANREYAKSLALPFGIVSDPNREVIPKIWRTQTVVGIENVAMRGVLVVGADGAVRFVHVDEDPSNWIGIDAIRAHLERSR